MRKKYRRDSRAVDRHSTSEVNDMRLFICIIALLVAATISTTVARADPSSTPVVTGCPAGFSLFAVGTPPYRVPAFLDNSANGGNGDGFVCAHAFPDAVRDAFCANGRGGCLLEQLGLPLYEFTEDNNPAQGATTAILDLAVETTR